MSKTLTEYAGLATIMKMGFITEQEALARWGKFEDNCLTELVAKSGGKPDDKTLTDARKELAEYRARLEAGAAKMRDERGKSADDILVEDVRAGRRNPDEILRMLEMHQEDDLRFLTGGATPTTLELEIAQRKHGPLMGRLKAAAAELKAGGSRFVKEDRRVRMADGAAATGKKITEKR